MFKLFRILSLFLFILLLSKECIAEGYELILVDPLDVRFSIEAKFLNDLGQVSGNADDEFSANGHAFIWDKNNKTSRIIPREDADNSDVTAMSKSGKLGGYFKYGGTLKLYVGDQNGYTPIEGITNPGTGSIVGVNDSGMVVIGANVWQNNVLEPIDPIDDANWLKPIGINNNGRIAGYYSSPNYRGFRSFIWDAIGGTRGLGGDGDNMVAMGLGDHGQVVGRAEYFGESGGVEEVHGYFWDADTPITEVPGSINSWALGVNSNNQVIGYFGDSPDNLWRSFIWTVGDYEITEIPGLELYGSSYASDINDKGQVVGTSYISDGARAIIWDIDNGTRQLDQMIVVGDKNVTLETAIAINESGQILARGNAGHKAYLLNPVSVQPISVDILPETCPNKIPINKHGNSNKGKISIAILGDYEVSVDQIDPESISILDVKPVNYAYEDVASPFIGELATCSDCTTNGPDGILDMTLKFGVSELLVAMEQYSEIVDGDCYRLPVAAKLSEEYGGGMLKGEDVILFNVNTK